MRTEHTKDPSVPIQRRILYLIINSSKIIILTILGFNRLNREVVIEKASFTLVIHKHTPLVRLWRDVLLTSAPLMVTCNMVQMEEPRYHYIEWRPRQSLSKSRATSSVKQESVHPAKRVPRDQPPRCFNQLNKPDGTSQ